MDEVAQNVPILEKIVAEIDGLAESGGKYAEAPHVIEVTLPMLCRYHRWLKPVSHRNTASFCLCCDFSVCVCFLFILL